MNKLPLNGITVIDFSHRLPGPFCGKILSDLGADVIKIEDANYKDPFQSEEFSTFDPSFLSWYKMLNAKKKILHFNYDNEVDQKAIREIVKNADALIMGLPAKARNKLLLNDSNLHFNKPFVVVELHASKSEKKSLHDLNALALSGILSLYIGKSSEKIISPPFLPIAGIAFGQKAATDLLACMLKAFKMNDSVFTKTYLDEVTKDLLGIFWDTSDRLEFRHRYLHNGQYPCYSIYQTKDLKYVALAAVEEKFWIRFCEVFQIPTDIDRYFNKDDSLFSLISNKLSALTVREIESQIGDEDLCLTVIV